MALLLATPLCKAWVTLSQVRFGAQVDLIQQQFHGDYSAGGSIFKRLGWIWNHPNDPASDDGLAGGITWAWDDSLCTKLLPRFSEDIFFIQMIDCSTIKAAVHRGFQSWSDNHARISFVDVTEECRALGRLDPDCPLAEIWVTALNTSASGGSSLTAGSSSIGVGSGENASAEAALLRDSVALGAASTTMVLIDSMAVAMEGGDGGALDAGVTERNEASSLSTAATARPSARYTHNFYYTSGMAASGPHGQPFVETYKAVISFNVGDSFCWYLDSTFCSGFHSLKMLAAPSVVLQVSGVLTYTIWGLALLFQLVQLAVLVRPQLRRGMTLSVRARLTLSIVSKWSTLGMTLRMLLLVLPPTFFQLIFLPCFKCFDFEAAATHEVGHVLGFSHPDADMEASVCCGHEPGVNVHHSELARMVGEQMVPTVDPAQHCADPWANVTEGVHAGATDLDPTSGVRASIMRAFTQHMQDVCLSADDLEGLLVLYPDCTTPIAATPVCYKTQHFIGLVRLGAFVLLPVLLALLLLQLLQACVRAHQLQRIKSREVVIHTQQRKLESAHEEKIGMAERIGALKKKLQSRKSTETARIEARAREIVAARWEGSMRAVEKACGADVSAKVRALTAPPREDDPALARQQGLAPARNSSPSGITGWLMRRTGLDRRTDRASALERGTDRGTDAEQDSFTRRQPRRPWPWLRRTSGGSSPARGSSPAGSSRGSLPRVSSPSAVSTSPASPAVVMQPMAMHETLKEVKEEEEAAPASAACSCV
jgi:hypothetical protein